ncbi:RNA polymerase sigma factor [Dinghuibacter silviterrae]|uniref:RNA polymerase sigma-70 factor (ECF subfamily) n=1 Tax=Dinghuibacter silviterrae TaxID=1539049 RepID=A0A4R8DFD8_9BACT|nr:sigma-70 family RNA polymerase sigma factor [Dinghuibacter silviterrae]TDW95954.1 RNA polymerase sigma-70 factor (ECF subfamily) [Dinghuibacter silviterrae]
MSLEVFHHRILPMTDKLFRFAFRLLQNAEEAEDAVQDLLLKIWGKRGEWDRWENLEAYCMTSMRNLCLERLRNKKVYKDPDAAGHLASTDRNPMERTQDRELRDRLQACMEALPEKHALVIQLREVEGLSYQEIATTLGMSLDQVKVCLHRARNAVKNVILKEDLSWSTHI